MRKVRGGLFLSVVVFLSLLSVSGCKKEETGGPIPFVPDPNFDIYAVGLQGTVAVYWKNTVSTDIKDPITADVSPTDIAVSGDDVYVPCDVRVLDRYVAKLWKNGTLTKLGGDERNSGTSAVAVFGSDSYVSGQEEEIHQGHKVYVARYWKNASVVVLGDGGPDGTTSSYAKAIVVAGPSHDIYTAGTELDSVINIGVAVYWKNGNKTTLTDGDHAANGLGIAVSGSDVYVVGDEVNASGVKVAKVWTNGIETALTNGTANSSATAVEIYGGDVYITGNDGTKAMLWKNGVGAELTDGVLTALTNSISVNSHGTFVFGKLFAGPAFRGSVMWKNAVVTEPYKGNDPAYQIYQATVVEH